MAQTELARLESDAADARKLVERAATLERLLKNPDFQEIVTKDYLEKEAVRLVHLKAAPEQQRPEYQAQVMKMLDAIGVFSQYLHGIQVMGRRGAEVFQDAQEAIAEIHAEAEA